MSDSAQKEHFGYVFIRAVTYAAGFSIQKPEVDDDSVDLIIAARGKLGTVRSPKLEIQVKSTGIGILTADNLPYRLELKNYDDLRHDDYLCPRILVVAVVPKDMKDWVTMNDKRLLARHCAYWSSLRGMAEHQSKAADPKVTVHLPRKQKFDVKGLMKLMALIGKGGRP
jgi:hypothetical protein